MEELTSLRSVHESSLRNGSDTPVDLESLHTYVKQSVRFSEVIQQAFSKLDSLFAGLPPAQSSMKSNTPQVDTAPRIHLKQPPDDDGKSYLPLPVTEGF